ncbi:Alpha/Beta hydrolase protein [Gongronella butleri]|nr:Alpha/Beta hydrolase protein [Gongronella butleri]
MGIRQNGLFLSLYQSSNYISSRGYQLVRKSVPIATQVLFQLQTAIKPWQLKVSQVLLLSQVLSTIFQVSFFISFVLLLLFESVAKRLVTLYIGRHATGRPISVVNAMDPRFDFFDHNLQDLVHEYSAGKRSESNNGSILSKMTHKPTYSQSLAYTLAVASKLSYENLEIIKYELLRAGFDTENTFRPFAYKNICAFVIEKDDMILLVFRGSNPLNVQNYLTNVDIRMTDVHASWGYLGKVHKGYWEALGEPKKETRNPSKDAAFAWYDELASHLRTQWMDPVDYRFLADADRTQQREMSMYEQAESYILNLATKSPSKRLYVTGHSLGASLATMFVAKLVQNQSPLLHHLGGVYTFGQPKLGDETFSKSVFDRKLSSKIFHHVYNNDLFTRLPSYTKYTTPPGTFVFIDSSYVINIFPPDPFTNTPVPVPPISHLHLSGLLDSNVLKRLSSENWIRVLYRVAAPYFINDHFAAEYPLCLQKGHLPVSVESGANKA